MSTQDSETQLPTPGLQLKECKISAPPPKKHALPKRILGSQRKLCHVLKFTKEENDFLSKGVTKHRFGQWMAILRDSDFKFQDGRMADSLMKRVGLRFSSGPCT